MGLKLYEIARLGMEPLLPPLYSKVRSRLNALVRRKGTVPRILDVGGRKSPYTIGLEADVTIIDLPRESDVQKALNLGVNKKMLAEMKDRRSNVSNVLLGDITKSDLSSDSFDIVVSVEVLEHVVEDELFVSEVTRVLKPGGIFLMTTPNGDWLENNNPDHFRHYERIQLAALLARHLDEVEVDYAIVGGKPRKLGLRPWSVRRPLSTASSAVGNVINTFQSSGEEIKSKKKGTHHLFAIGKKPIQEAEEA